MKVGLIPPRPQYCFNLNPITLHLFTLSFFENAQFNNIQLRINCWTDFIDP